MAASAAQPKCTQWPPHPPGGDLLQGGPALLHNFEYFGSFLRKEEVFLRCFALYSEVGRYSFQDSINSFVPSDF